MKPSPRVLFRLWQHQVKEALLARIHQREAPRLAASIQAIIDNTPHAQAIFLFAPGLSWRRGLFQRPQQLARALARQGVLVFYLEPPGWRQKPGLEALEPNLYLLRGPVEAAGALRSAYLYLLPWSHSLGKMLHAAPLVYDVLDDLSAFDVDQALLRYQHARRLASAQLVLASATVLFEQVSAARPDALLLPNGVEVLHFEAPDVAPPPDLLPILESGKPLVGYIGALAEWFDYELLGHLAELRSDLAFVLIGPDHDGSLRSSHLLDQPGIHWLGVKDYAALPGYLRFFDVATIPFKVNDITNATSPIKLFEYFASGKPVVATPIRECANQSRVLLAATAEEFSAQIDVALSLSKEKAFPAELKAIALANTWDKRAGLLLERLFASRR